MKKIIAFLAAVIMIVTISACAKNPAQSIAVDDQPSMFVEIERGNSWRVVYHKETKVMYAISWASYNSGNFTLLVNPDGTPMLYEGE